MYLGFKDETFEIIGKKNGNDTIEWLVSCRCGDEQWVKDARHLTIKCGCGCSGIYITTGTTVAIPEVIRKIKSVYYYTLTLDKGNNGGAQPMGVGEFIEWSLNNGYTQGKRLVLLDSNSGVVKDNCKWVDRENKVSSLVSRATQTPKVITFNELVEALNVREYGVQRDEIFKLIRSGLYTTTEAYDMLEWLGTRDGEIDNAKTISMIQLEVVGILNRLDNIKNIVLYNLVKKGQAGLKLGNIKRTVQKIRMTLIDILEELKDGK